MEQVKVGNWPDAATLTAFQDAIIEEVCRVSGRPDLAWNWILRVWDSDVTFDELYVTGDTWELLDAKLASAVRKVLLTGGESGRRIIAKSTEMKVTLRQRIRGRQLLYLLIREFALAEDFVEAFAFEDLVEVQVIGDDWKSVDAFLNKWEQVLSGCKQRPGPKLLGSLLYGKLKRLSCLHKEIGEYKRAMIGTVERIYENLKKRVELFTESKRHDVLRNEQLQALAGKRPLSSQQAAAAAAAALLPPVGKQKPKKEKNEQTPGPGAVADAVPKGYCFAFAKDGKCDKGKECKYLHEAAPMSGKGRGKGKSKGKKVEGQSRGKSPGAAKKTGISCSYFKKNGSCKKGDDCEYSHAPSEPAGVFVDLRLDDDSDDGSILFGCIAFPGDSDSDNDATTTSMSVPEVRSRPKKRLAFDNHFFVWEFDIDVGARLSISVSRAKRVHGRTWSLARLAKHRAKSSACLEDAQSYAKDLHAEVASWFAVLPAASPVLSSIDHSVDIIGDTGSGNHILGASRVGSDDKVYTGKPKRLATANGVITVANRVKTHMKALGVEIDSLVLEDSPSVLSIGRLCMSGDFDFIWRRGQQPFLVTVWGENPSHL